ncbi:hypothetical protein POSPLADRAFT_1159837 [Postia placenta MAD-698-R-SB12]|uniref:U6 snRNA phosphodiesterase 1 n=1 Tax=Postia placenta MAD-698-R-SB12 TaxID=670580 RepID=A0A1X6MJD9_9APHY|nr:hypothetical protein POSPLADRAFT_1159837 [Postia placenta MAD-698-R-SB12]OSX56490.1 hypothetical protein POSPLADRAFT_1159837 [Postia placenta MAD-698-R-SB12]
MKRNASLVSYESSSDEDKEIKLIMKCRRLPSLPSSLLPQVPKDDPALHQGRIRTTPHVEGQFAAYVYVPLIVDKHSALSELAMNAFQRAQELVPSLHPIGLCDKPNADSTGSDHFEFHISLTRPFYLRAHQRDELKHAVKQLAQGQSAFVTSFTSFSELKNDENTRVFLTMEIGAGHAEVRVLSEALTPILRSIRQKEFYSEPRFHVSIAWALLDRAASGSCTIAGSETITQTSDSSQTFCSISALPPTLVSALNAEFSSLLSAKHIGSFEMNQVCVKVGKDVKRCTLRG